MTKSRGPSSTTHHSPRATSLSPPTFLAPTKQHVPQQSHVTISWTPPHSPVDSPIQLSAPPPPLWRYPHTVSRVIDNPPLARASQCQKSLFFLSSYISSHFPIKHVAPLTMQTLKFDPTQYTMERDDKP